MTPTHYIIPVEVVENQLLSLYSQLKEESISQYNRGIIQGLIEAYLAIQMQSKIVIPDKNML